MYLLDPAEIVAFQAEGELVHIVTGNRRGPRYLSDHSLSVLETEAPEAGVPPHPSRDDHQHRSHPPDLAAIEQALAAEDVERI